MKRLLQGGVWKKHDWMLVFLPLAQTSAEANEAPKSVSRGGESLTSASPRRQEAAQRAWEAGCVPQSSEELKKTAKFRACFHGLKELLLCT